MFHKDFVKWSLIATSRIRFNPDREAVYQELMLHLQDRQDSLIEQGLGEEAAAKALEAMGDAYALAPQLGKIHSPFWGYFLRACQITLIVVLCICIIPIWRYCANINTEAKNIFGFSLYDPTSYGESTGRTLLHLSQPDASFSTDGSTFTATDAVLYQNDRYDRNTLQIRIVQTSLLPNDEQEQYYGVFSSGPVDHFFARDNLGNYYESWFEGQNSTEKNYINIHTSQIGVFTNVHECWISFFPEDAQWVEICYERDGREFQLHIDLTGGANP